MEGKRADDNRKTVLTMQQRTQNAGGREIEQLLTWCGEHTQMMAAQVDGVPRVVQDVSLGARGPRDAGTHPWPLFLQSQNCSGRFLQL